MRLPKTIQDLIDSFESLPGIGPKTAQRLTFYLLRVPQDNLDRFSRAVKDLKSTTICEKCKNVGEERLCIVCKDSNRDRSVICVVESPLDVIAFEKSGYRGLYHVLHGRISPLSGIGPEELFIGSLLKRIKEYDQLEVIIATNPDLEGEATAVYLRDRIFEIAKKSGKNIKVSRIGRGIPTGADIEFVDEVTLRKSLEGRTKL